MASKVDDRKKMAWTRSLVACRHSVDDDLQGAIIYAKQVTKGSGKDIFDAIQGGTISTPPMQPSPLELEGQPAAIQCLWVGLLPPNVPESVTVPSENKEQASTAIGETAAPSPAKRQKMMGPKKSASINSVEDATCLIESPAALRVVMRIDSTNANLYVLVHMKDESQDGLCVGMGVDGDNVFFFSKFMDMDATSYQARKDKTTSLLKTWKSNVANSGPAPLKLAQTYDKHKINTAEPKSNAIANVLAHFLTYKVTGDPDSAKTALSELKKMDTDRLPNTVVKKFLLAQQALDDSEAKSFLRWLETMFPDLRGESLKSEEICVLSNAMCQAKISVELRLLRAFVVCFVIERRASIAEEETTVTSEGEAKEADHMDVDSVHSDYDPTSHVKNVADLIYRLMGPRTTRLPISMENVDSAGFSGFLAAEIEELANINSTADRQIDLIKESQGNLAIPQSLPRLFSTLAEKPDVDSAKLYFQHLQGMLLDKLKTLVIEPIKHRIAALSAQREQLALVMARVADSEQSEEEQ